MKKSQSTYAEERDSSGRLLVSNVTSSRPKKIPIMECFGPTIQGEGLMSGTFSHFLRTGGCPLKCKWCDAMHAVDPKRVKEGRTLMDWREVLDAVQALPWAPYVTLTGGDPCMWHDLGNIIGPLNLSHMRIAVETQGTLFPWWLEQCDVITFSPKGPSSGNPVDPQGILEWLKNNGTKRKNRVCVKVVVGTKEDLNYAMSLYEQVPMNLIDAFYFTALTEMAAPTGAGMVSSAIRILNTVDGFQRLANALTTRAEAGQNFHEKTHVGCQQHVLLWPHTDRGV